MTYDQIVRGLRDSNYELQNEGRRVRAGLKTEQDTAGIVERYAWLYSDEALATVGEPDGEERKRVRAALLRGIVERRTAAQEDRLSTYYANAVAEAGDEHVPFYTAQAQAASEPDPRRREALGEGIGAVMAEAEDLHDEYEAVALETIDGFGPGGATAFWAGLKEIDYGALRQEVERIAAAAASRYRHWVEPRMETASHAFGECPQVHMSFFRGLREHDAAFAAECFEPAMRRTFERLELDLFASPTINIDLADRPAKSPRASVWVPEAGREVHLLTRPSGGSHDYAAFLHESGHALHYGLTDPAIGWPLANLGRSMAYTEVWSFLFERIGHDPAWLAEATGIADADAERVARDLSGVDLMLFMRYVGKFTAELDLYAGDSRDRIRGQRIYVERPGAVTGFGYDQRAWQSDRDPGFYSADYLRAWLAEAALDDALRRRYGERWWASREAGAWLREQWLRGSEPEAEELVAEAGGRPWSGDAFLARLERLLPAAA